MRLLFIILGLLLAGCTTNQNFDEKMETFADDIAPVSEKIVDRGQEQHMNDMMALNPEFATSYQNAKSLQEQAELLKAYTELLKAQTALEKARTE